MTGSHNSSTESDSARTPERQKEQSIHDESNSIHDESTLSDLDVLFIRLRASKTIHTTSCAATAALSSHSTNFVNSTVQLRNDDFSDTENELLGNASEEFVMCSVHDFDQSAFTQTERVHLTNQPFNIQSNKM